MREPPFLGAGLKGPGFFPEAAAESKKILGGVAALNAPLRGAGGDFPEREIAITSVRTGFAMTVDCVSECFETSPGTKPGSGKRSRGRLRYGCFAAAGASVAAVVVAKACCGRSVIAPTPSSGGRPSIKKPPCGGLGGRRKTSKIVPPDCLGGTGG